MMWNLLIKRLQPTTRAGGSNIWGYTFIITGRTIKALREKYAGYRQQKSLAGFFKIGTVKLTRL